MRPEESWLLLRPWVSTERPVVQNRNGSGAFKRKKSPLHILGENIPLWLFWFPWGGQFSLNLALSFRNPIPMPDLFSNRVYICFSICPLRCPSIASKRGKENRKKKKKTLQNSFTKSLFLYESKSRKPSHFENNKPGYKFMAFL